jgi:uncharacterized membrane protein
MSFKSLEMQFVLHKNGEAGIRQNQLLQKPVLDQALLAGSLEKTAELERHKSTNVEETSRPNINHQSTNQRNQGAVTRSKKNEPITKEEALDDNSVHPYKGHHIDLSL